MRLIHSNLAPDFNTLAQAYTRQNAKSTALLNLPEPKNYF